MMHKTTPRDAVLSIAIAVPTYNESANVPTLFAEIKKAVKPLKNAYITVFVIDDNSPDGTADIARRKVRKTLLPNLDVQVLVKQKKEGLGKAYIWAFRQIMKQKQHFDYILEMDADLSHDPKYLKDFVKEAQDGKDVVVASRYIKGGATPDWSWDRKFLSKFGNYYVRLFLGNDFTDWTGGHNMYKTDLLQKLDLDTLPNGYAFQLALKDMALKCTSNTAEIPIVFPDRTEGESKIPKDTMKRTLVLVPRLAWLNKKAFKSPLFRYLTLLGLIAGTCIATALVFLVKTQFPESGRDSWPIAYMHNSDNGVLWQFWRDVFSRSDISGWHFSPQALIFPEMIIAFFAYVFSRGDLPWYYLITAIIQMSVLTLIIYHLVRLLFKPHGKSEVYVFGLTLLAVSPLLIFPLAVRNPYYSPFVFHMLATYYFGLYMCAFLLPVIYLAKQWTTKIILATIVMLSAISNPLIIAMLSPALAVVGLVAFLGAPSYDMKAIRGSLHNASGHISKTGVRILFLRTIQNPYIITISAIALSYIAYKYYLLNDLGIVTNTETTRDMKWFTSHLTSVQGYLNALAHLRIGKVILVAVALSLLLSVIIMKKYLSTKIQAEKSRLLILLFLGLLPATGVVAMYLVMSIHVFYFWLFQTGVFVIDILLIAYLLRDHAYSARAIKLLAGFALLAFMSIALYLFIDSPNTSRPTLQYFTFKSREARCIDDNLPTNAIGYSTEDRHYTLTSDDNIRVVKLLDDILEPSNELANVERVPVDSGNFFIVDSKRMSSTEFLKTSFGEPSKVIVCDENTSIWTYDDTTKVRSFFENIKK